MIETAHSALFKIAHRQSFFDPVTFAQSLHGQSHVDALAESHELDLPSNDRTKSVREVSPDMVAA
jgi:hypothetical protein